MNYEEIAREMELSPETVRTHIKQALKSLRKYLSERSINLALLLLFL
jgi:DNA-directed RNA polymerase specialized sigma24 family protein